MLKCWPSTLVQSLFQGRSIKGTFKRKLGVLSSKMQFKSSTRSYNLLIREVKYASQIPQSESIYWRESFVFGGGTFEKFSPYSTHLQTRRFILFIWKLLKVSFSYKYGFTNCKVLLRNVQIRDLRIVEFNLDLIIHLNKARIRPERQSLVAMRYTWL